jgi:hypothetical protein
MGLFRRTQGHDEADATTVIDLRDPAPGAPQWGSPLPCPSCAGRGYLDHIDPFREIMFLHCTVCFERYAVAKEDLDRITA